MYLPKSKKTRIIALEGAAGVGKTTVQHFLYQELVNRGVSVKTIPEFTGSPLGAIKAWRVERINEKDIPDEGSFELAKKRLQDNHPAYLLCTGI